MGLNRSSSSNKTNNSYQLGLRNLSGVPVLDVFGKIDAGALSAIEDMASRLLCAGHNQLVLNFRHAAAANAVVVRSLKRIGLQVKKRYGRVTLIPCIGEISQRMVAELKGLLSFSSSEADALHKIKGIVNFADTEHPGTTARLAE